MLRYLGILCDCKRVVFQDKLDLFSVEMLQKWVNGMWISKVLIQRDSGLQGGFKLWLGDTAR